MRQPSFVSVSTENMYITVKAVWILGTGSSILGSITAKKLRGAKRSLGTDLDENAITAVGEERLASMISAVTVSMYFEGNIIDSNQVCSRTGGGYEKACI